MPSFVRLTFAVFAAVLVSVFASAFAFADAPKSDSESFALSHFAEFGFQSPKQMKRYFTIRSVTVRPTKTDLTSEQLKWFDQVPIAGGVANVINIMPTPTPAPTPTSGGTTTLPGSGNRPTTQPGLPGSTGSSEIDTWIVIGEKIWKLIQDNKPVADVSTRRVIVVPLAAQTNWDSMTNWKGPALYSFTIEAKNMMGMIVMSHTYTLAYNYGGQFNGHGAFLANATVIPTHVQVAWGFKLGSSLEVGQPVNTASLADPVPGLDLQVKWNMDSVLKHEEGRENFFVKGNGQALQTAQGVN